MTFQFPERISPALLARFARRRISENRADLMVIFLVAGLAVLKGPPRAARNRA